MHDSTSISPSPTGADPTKIVAASIPDASSRTVPIFIGNSGYGAILDATTSTPDRHFHVPAAVEKALAAEDLEYLKLKGCFSLPANSSDLITAYFEFVHPAFPVIDAATFLKITQPMVSRASISSFYGACSPSALAISPPYSHEELAKKHTSIVRNCSSTSATNTTKSSSCNPRYCSASGSSTRRI